MTAYTPSDAKAKVALTAALEAARRCREDDVHSTLELVKQLKELEVCIDHSNSARLLPLCTLAGKLSDKLIEAGATPRADLLQWVRELLGYVAQSVGVQADDPHATTRDPSHTLTATGIHSRLALVDGQRLGEILVRMSYLRAPDLERALVLQKQKGCRLGEALVELELLSPEELDAALRVQNQRRNRKSDPWMQWRGDEGEAKRKTGSR